MCPLLATWFCSPLPSFVVLVAFVVLFVFLRHLPPHFAQLSPEDARRMPTRPPRCFFIEYSSAVRLCSGESLATDGNLLGRAQLAQETGYHVVSAFQREGERRLAVVRARLCIRAPRQQQLCRR